MLVVKINTPKTGMVQVVTPITTIVQSTSEFGFEYDIAYMFEMIDHVFIKAVNLFVYT